MLEQIASFMVSFGYVGVFLVMLANSDFLPLFTETTLPLAGFFASEGKLKIELIILASVLGDFVGGIIAYYIGSYFGNKVILSFIRKHGKYVLLNEKSYQKAVKLINKHGAPIVFAGKLTPGLKTYTSVAAGISKVRLPKYVISSVCASVIYNSIFTYFGFYLGKNWFFISRLAIDLQSIVFIILTVIILILILYGIRKRRIHRS